MNYTNKSFNVLFGLTLVLSLSACGNLGFTDKGLFSDANTPTTLGKPGELVGTWELDTNSLLSGGTLTDQNLLNSANSRTRIYFESDNPNNVKITTYCERRDFSSNKIKSTYVNSEAYVRLEDTSGATPGTTAVTNTSGRMSITGFVNQQISGDKDFSCPAAFSSTGIYSYSIQDGAMVMDLISSNVNNLNQFSSTTALNSRSSFRKVRD